MRYEIAVETERPFPGGAEALADHLESFVEDSGFVDEWFSVEWGPGVVRIDGEETE